MKWGCWGHWGHWGCWGCWGHWGYWGSKAWKIKTGDFRVIQALEFSFILMFWKKYLIGVQSWNIKLNFSSFSVKGCWGQPMLLFWKMVVVPKNFLSQHSRIILKPNLTWIYLSVRANSWSPVQNKIPCSCDHKNEI